MKDSELQAMIADACLGAGSAEELDPRLALYRRLVRNNLLGVTAKMMPRTRARLNALPPGGAFDRSFDDFLASVGPRTHYLRDVPGEFLAWAAPRWAEQSEFPAYAPDLAAHELVEFQVGAVPPAPGRPPPGEVALDRPLLFAEAIRLVRYRFAVHELPADGSAEPEERPVSLLVYRDAAHAVGWMEVSAISARLLEALFAGEPLGQAVATAAKGEGVPLTDTLLTDAARLLSELGELGVLLGAAET